MSAPGAGWGGLDLTGERPTRQVAYFVSAHGFGHATRACAVMAALRAREAQIHFHVFSAAPAWVFAESLADGYTLHPAPVDVGLVQQTTWVEDLPATLRQLDDFLPFDAFLVRDWAAWLNRLQCELVICDIAPLGLAVARAAEIPSVLIENFTWDWIYAGYLAEAPGLARHLPILREAFASATHHIQIEPICAPDPKAERLAPISRRPRTERAATREALGISDADLLVLITVGGASGMADIPVGVAVPSKLVYAITTSDSLAGRSGQILRLPQGSGIYHPDLVQASDVVIGKAGYSTMAEACWAGVPFGVVSRPRFRESDVITGFVERRQLGRAISTTAFLAGEWGDCLTALLEAPPITRPVVNGADQAAALILSYLP